MSNEEQVLDRSRVKESPKMRVNVQYMLWFYPQWCAYMNNAEMAREQAAGIGNEFLG